METKIQHATEKQVLDEIPKVEALMIGQRKEADRLEQLAKELRNSASNQEYRLKRLNDRLAELRGGQPTEQTTLL